MNAAANPRRGLPRSALIAGGILLALIVVVGLCEAAGWPFLVAPLQRRLSETLERRVDLGSGEPGKEGPRIRLIGSVRMDSPSIEIGAPSWSIAPHMVLAHNARLQLGYGDLWRAYRGGPLHVRKLQADDLDAQVERLSDGRASWQFGPPKTTEPERPARLPSFGELRVGDGTLVFRDAVLEADLDARFSLRERSGAEAPASAASQAASAASAAGTAGSGKAAHGLEFHATGTYRNMPLKADLVTTGVLEAVGADAVRVTQPVTLDVAIGRARIRFDGAASDPLHLSGLNGRFDVEGPSLASVGDPLGVTLPTTGPFLTRGTLSKQGDVWKADVAEATIGGSRIAGSFTFDHGPKVPVLTGTLGGTRLVLADLGPALGGVPRNSAPGASAPAGQKAPAKSAGGEEPPSKKGGKVLPDRRFDLPRLRAMNADVSVDIPYVDLGSSLLEPLKPLKGRLRLQEGVLTLTGLDARTAEGRLSGNLQLDGRNDQALWTADLQLRGVRLERWLHQARSNGAPPYISGRMEGEAKVTGRGRSTAEILGSLDGSIRLHLSNATVSHVAVEAAGLDPAQALGVLFKGDEPLAIGCNVADLQVENGIAKPRVFVIDTRDSTIWITGTVSLKSEALDLTAIVSPKDFSPLTVRSPIHVKGTFSQPSVSVEAGTIGGKVGAAALLSLINPLAAIIPFIDTGASDDAKREAEQCRSLAQRGDLSKVPKGKPASK